MAANVASTPLDFRSSINSVLNVLPQGHEKAFKQAIYTTAANLFVLSVIAAGVAVYYILEAFLQPLLWAVLCGTFLYPFKRSLTRTLRSWLNGLQKSNTPVIVGSALLPFQFLNSLYDYTFNKFTQNFKLILGGIFGITSLYLLWHFGPVRHIFDTIRSVLLVTYHMLGYFSSFWVWSLVIGYLASVVFFWTPETKRYLRYLSVPVWIVLILHIATVAGYLRVPLFISLVFIVSVGFVAEMKAANRLTTEGRTRTPVETVWHILTGDSDQPGVSASESTEIDDDKDKESISPENIGQKSVPTELAEEIKEEPVPLRRPEEIKKPSHLPVRDPSTPQRRKNQGPRLGATNKESQKESHSRSYSCFVYLLWMFVLTRLWMHIWLVQLLLPIAFVMWLFKSLLIQLSSEEGIFGDKVKQIKLFMSNWLETRKDVLAPRWIRGLLKLITTGDGKIVSLCESSLDSMTSVLFILLLLVGTSLLTVFCAVQIQQESMHLVKMTSEVLNRTLSSEINSWLPNGEDMQVYMDSMVGNAYLYGRNWIAARLRDMVSGPAGNNTHLEAQVLEVWDRLYENWLARKSNNATSNSVSQPGFQILPYDLMSFQSVWELLSKGNGFNISQVVDFIKDNIGTFMSVLDSVWMVLKGNMNLVFTLMTATLSVLFGGGTALLNFVISSFPNLWLGHYVVPRQHYQSIRPLFPQKKLIFLTTLFYLLASSGNQYKPVEWFASINPTQSGNSFSKAVEEAITGVFMASLKMAAFYGVYTWLTHTWFGINIVFIPSALAAIFAAIPFLGTYWAALPAILDLWLVQGKGFHSLLLLIFHLLPISYVDTAIYSDIKGGHPYLTGLAIAGGIYWMGLEGAIIGPILLCCLVVAVRVYGTMLQPDPATPEPGYGRGGKSMPSGMLSRSVHGTVTPIDSMYHGHGNSNLRSVSNFEILQKNSL